MKHTLCANPFVQPISLTKEATVTTDASKKAIGVVLSQEGHPVTYVLRNLSQGRTNLPNIEQEALAIILVVSRLKQVLFGRRFSLRTNNKPLKYFCAQYEENPKTVSAKITRYTRRTDPLH